MKDIRALFPDLVVDDPQLFKVFYWATGTTYWNPGNYSPEVLSQSSVHPLPKVLPNVWLCGESWSTCQAWVEGAVKQTILCHKELERTL
jgi:monoamine oxidase